MKECVLYFDFGLSLWHSSDSVDPCCAQVLDDYAKKMRDAENESHEGKRKTESLWPIFQLNHARTRYIYELYYKRQAISRELYDWLLKQGYADAK